MARETIADLKVIIQGLEEALEETRSHRDQMQEELSQAQDMCTLLKSEVDVLNGYKNGAEGLFKALHALGCGASDEIGEALAVMIDARNEIFFRDASTFDDLFVVSYSENPTRRSNALHLVGLLFYIKT